MSQNWRTKLDRALPSFLRTIKANLGLFLRQVTGRLVSVSSTPTFVLGNQKSGTTVIAAALARAANQSVTLDLRDLTEEMLTGVYDGTIPLSAFINRYRLSFSRQVIKEPNLTFLYSRLAEHFPEATFLLIVRDPRDNLRSFLEGFHLPGDLKSLGPEHRNRLNPVWQAIVFNEGLPIEGDSYIHGLAKRWNAAADVHLENQTDVHLLRYEDFCANKVPVIKSTVRRLGLSCQNDPDDIVQQQYQGRGTRDVDLLNFFGERNLALINQQCGEHMQALGYEKFRH
jgi:hypothetical protein